MNVIQSISWYALCCLSMPLCAFENPKQLAKLVAFAQDPITYQASAKSTQQPRRVRFVNNIQQTATGALKEYSSLALVDPVCSINGTMLQADEERELEVSNDRCLVKIGLRPGISATIATLAQSYWGIIVQYIEKYLLRSRTLTFICYLPDCETVDTATLLFNACAQSESENFNIPKVWPDLELSLPTPVEY